MKQLTDTESAAIRALAPAERLAALKGSRAERAVGFERAAVDEGARSVELAFASETPYTRWWGTEILDISAASMRLDRIRDAAPLLVGHDPSDHVGVVEEVKIGADRNARARVRFGRSARAEEVFRDVLDEIRTKVSNAGEPRIRRLPDQARDGRPDFLRRLPRDADRVGTDVQERARQMLADFRDVAAPADVVRKSRCGTLA